MASGIYLLTFSSGAHYVGKSVDVENRWKQHFYKMEKGIAAKNMQEQFNQYGYPQTNIIFECHPDHLDVLEPLYIEMFNSDKDIWSLNSDIPTVYYKPTEEDADLINSEDMEPYWKMSTIEHIKEINKLLIDLSNKEAEVWEEAAEEIVELQEKLEESEKQRKHWQNLNETDEMRDLTINILNKSEEIRELKQELEFEKNKSWFKKVFGG